MLQSQYCGFRVKLVSSQIGDVIGTVCNVTESKIELSNAIMNGMGAPIPHVAVESQFIQDLSILATEAGDNSNTLALGKNVETTLAPSGRSERREKLRNIPNAYNAYVCPDSPPIIHRTTGISDHFAASTEKTTSGLLQLDPTSTRPGAHKSPRNQHERKNNRRSFSLSEAVVSSEVSGTESDSFCRPQYPSGQRGTHHYQGRSHGRAHPRSGSTTNKQGSKVDWEQVRVEDFIDQEFDFEKNLALFDKTAFYEMVDLRNGISPKPIVAQRDPSPKPLVEGPDGVGSPLMGNIPHSEPNSGTTKGYYDDCTMTTNTATLSSSKQRREHSVPYYHPSLQPFSNSSIDLYTQSGNASRVSCTTQSPSGSHSWYSTSGLRVPVLPSDEHTRVLHYLATGKDFAKETGTAGPFTGLTWGRLLETAGRGFLDFAIGQLRQASHTPQRSSRRPPPRILVIPGREDFTGAFAVSTARMFAVRGASVLLLRPHVGLNGMDQPLCKSELALCLQLAPCLGPYGVVEDQEDPLNETDEDEDEGELDSSGGVQLHESSMTNLLSISDGDSEMTGSLTSVADFADISPLYRVWVSRSPGLKIVRRSAALVKLPTNFRIDLVIIGHCLGEESLDFQLGNWLKSHKALSRVAYLMPESSDVGQLYSTNAISNWIVELGLPTLYPMVSDSPLHSSTSHLLVDVGMSRHSVLRLTRNLKYLPPYGLFDSESVVQLKQSPPPSN